MSPSISLSSQDQQNSSPQWRSVQNDSLHVTVGSESSSFLVLEVSGDVEVDLVAEASSEVTVLCLQEQEATMRMTSTIEEGAKVHWKVISLAPTEATVRSCLVGAHAESNVDWMFYAKDAERQSISAWNTFEEREGSGEILLKGVAEDTAHVHCDGMILIGLQGGGTDTYLTEDVLMLDATARVDALPGLEIKTNDVKASHSATVSRVTDEDLFYFASRGIDMSAARHMYILGYLSAITNTITHDEVRERVLQSIESKYAL